MYSISGLEADERIVAQLTACSPRAKGVRYYLPCKIVEWQEPASRQTYLGTYVTQLKPELAASRLIYVQSL